MNKYQEAIEVEKLKHAISSIKIYMSYPNGRLCSAGEIAVEAIEKQITKKPKAHRVDVEKLKIGNANWSKGTTVYHCPNCNKFISRTYDFCHKCGQAIDWSEVEE